MMKRIYFDIEETVITRRKGYIDIDMDYTQIYSCFNQIAPKISSATTFKLLFYLLAHKMNDSNGIGVDVRSYEMFNNHLKEIAGESSVITRRTFTNCMKELKEAGALVQTARGLYYANPNMFWQAEIAEREKFIKEETEARLFELRSTPSLTEKALGAQEIHYTEAKEDTKEIPVP